MAGASAGYMLPGPHMVSHGVVLPDAHIRQKDYAYQMMSMWLADLEDRRQFTANDALAASGDCFVTIATHLDKLAQGLPSDSACQIELEHIVRSLLYLQEHYTVVAKHKLDQ